MEGKYAKIGTIVAVITLLITIWQLRKDYVDSFKGEWLMNSKIQKAELTTYIGMEIKWKLYLTQSGKSVEGTAEKIEVNGTKLDYLERTSLDIKGSVNGDVFTLKYIENGKKRKTSGVFEGRLNGNEFRGTFSQTASDTEGIITGSKIDKTI